MMLLNFSHPLTAEQLQQVEILAKQPVEKVIDLPVQFDTDQSFLPQLEALVERIPLSGEALQKEPILVNLPSLNYIAALLLAELHGRMGYFPTCMRLRPVKNSAPTCYEVAEIINLQQVRETARMQRNDK